MLPAKRLSGKSQPSWLPTQTHSHSFSRTGPAERLAEDHHPPPKSREPSGFSKTLETQRGARPRNFWHLQVDQSLSGGTQRCWGGSLPPSPVHRPNIPESDSAPSGKDPEGRDSPGVSPHPPAELEAAVGMGHPAGSWPVEFSVATGCRESRFPAPGGGRRSERSQGRLAWEERRGAAGVR